MKLRLPLLSAALVSLLLSSPASAADLTWTYSPSKTATGAQTINGITITPSYVWKVDESFSAYSGGVQIGKTDHNVISITYDFSAFPSDIKSVAITGKSGAENSGKNTVSATIGLEPFTGSAALTSSEGTITLTAPEGTQTGNLSILIDNPRGDEANSKSQAIYIKSIVVTYKDPSSAGLTQLATPTGLAPSDIGYFGFSLSWNSVLNATNGYMVTLSPADGNISVNGTTATMTGLAEGETYDVSIVAKGDGTGTDDSEAATLSVTTLTAPAISAPDLSYTVSASALTVSWPAQNDAAFSVLAWTNKPVNGASQNFAGYAANGTVPEGWVFENSHTPYTGSSYSQNPVDFKATGNWIATPEFGGIVSSVTFRFRSTDPFTGSFTVYGTTGSTNRADWVSIQSWERSNSSISVSTETLSDLEANGFTRLVFAFEKSAGSGNIAFGSFSVTGTGVGKEPVYLPGYGPSPTDVNTTSVTFANPVVGETYCVEVTATGLSGRTASSKLGVPVPAHPAVISIQ